MRAHRLAPFADGVALHPRRRATLGARVAALLIASCLRAQQSIPASNTSNASPAGDTKESTTADDHRQMVQQLGITTLRPGPSGNEQAPCRCRPRNQPRSRDLSVARILPTA